MNINFTIPSFVKKSDFSISNALENNNINLVKSIIFIKDLIKKNNIIVEELDKISTDSSESTDSTTDSTDSSDSIDSLDFIDLENSSDFNIESINNIDLIHFLENL